MFGFALWRSGGVAASRSSHRVSRGRPQAGFKSPQPRRLWGGAGGGAFQAPNCEGSWCRSGLTALARPRGPLFAGWLASWEECAGPRGGQQVLLALSEGPLLGVSASLHPDACWGKGGMEDSG